MDIVLITTLILQDRSIDLFGFYLSVEYFFNFSFKTVLSLIRQKGKSKSGYFKKTKYAKFSEKQTFLTPAVRIRG